MLPCQNPKTGLLVMEAGLNVTLSKSEDRPSGHGGWFECYLVKIRRQGFWSLRLV